MICHLLLSQQPRNEFDAMLLTTELGPCFYSFMPPNDSALLDMQGLRTVSIANVYLAEQLQDINVMAKFDSVADVPTSPFAPAELGCNPVLSCVAQESKAS